VVILSLQPGAPLRTVCYLLSPSTECLGTPPCRRRFIGFRNAFHGFFLEIWNLIPRPMLNSSSPYVDYSTEVSTFGGTVSLVIPGMVCPFLVQRRLPTRLLPFFSSCSGFLVPRDAGKVSFWVFSEDNLAPCLSITDFSDTLSVFPTFSPA